MKRKLATVVRFVGFALLAYFTGEMVLMRFTGRVPPQVPALLVYAVVAGNLFLIARYVAALARARCHSTSGQKT